MDKGEETTIALGDGVMGGPAVKSNVIRTTKGAGSLTKILVISLSVMAVLSVVQALWGKGGGECEVGDGAMRKLTDTAAVGALV